MRSSHTLSPGPAGRLGSRLLLALALCACGGEGADTARDTVDTVDTTSTVAQSAADESCTTPPPVVDARYFRGSWDSLSQHLHALGARFPAVAADSGTALVRLCENCIENVQLVISPESHAYCATPEQVQSREPRIMGIFVLGTDFEGDTVTGWKQPFRKGDTIYAFADTTDGPATLLYRKRHPSGEAALDSVVTAPAGSWMFYYCDDGHVGSRPEAKWRSRWVRGGGARASGEGGATTAVPPGNDDDTPPNNYGWMACASGCCQFYTPPPNPIVQGPRPGTRAAAADSGATPAPEPGRRPSWCPVRTPSRAR